MIIVSISGGLGNQLFQYAAGRAVALRAGLALKLDTQTFTTEQRRKYRLDLFQIVEEIATPEEIARFFPPNQSALQQAASWIWQRLLPYHLRPLLTERSRAFNPWLLRVKHSTYMAGFWQSERYFQDYSDVIRREFTLRPATNEANRNILQEMANTQAVCLHVRRGDYASNPTTLKHHGLLSLDYYQAAIQRIRDSVSDPHFFVFSDGMEWVKENLELPYPTTYVEHNGEEQDYEDLRLMSHCRYHVIANSSFSWWGAWLADFPDKLVIAPQQWYADSNLVTPDRYPNGWIIL